MKTGRFASCALLLCLLLPGCQKPQPGVPPFGQASFADYQQQIRAWVATHRAFQSDDRETELTWNTPQEWRPQGVARKGILLIHGLGDAPGSFTDLGPALARQVFWCARCCWPGTAPGRKTCLTSALTTGGKR